LFNPGEYAFDRANNERVQIISANESWGFVSYKVYNPVTNSVYKPKVATVNKTKVATVNKTTGKITAKKKGTAKITAIALNGKKLTLTVKVVTKAKTLKKVAFVKHPKKLKVGKTAGLKIKLTPPSATNAVVKFKSNRLKIIGIDKAGKITALKKGKAKITVKACGKSKTITVTVK
jgi:uncharacterized protein YjdB